MTNEIEYLKSIIRPLISNDLEVERTDDERGILLTIKLATEDIGKVIGKGGETARAIRRLIRQFGMSQNMHISVRIYEPGKEDHTQRKI